MLAETSGEFFDFSNAALLDEDFDTFDAEYVSAAEHKLSDTGREHYQLQDRTL